jgi:hypothetical protein
MKESTHPRVTGKANFAEQYCRMSVRVTGVLFSEFFLIHSKISFSQSAAAAGCRPRGFGGSKPLDKAIRTA